MAATKTPLQGGVRIELKCDIKSCERETVVLAPRDGPIGEIYPEDGPEWTLIRRESDGATAEIFAACPLHEFAG